MENADLDTGAELGRNELIAYNLSAVTYTVSDNLYSKRLMSSCYLQIEINKLKFTLTYKFRQCWLP